MRPTVRLLRLAWVLPACGALVVVAPELTDAVLLACGGLVALVAFRAIALLRLPVPEVTRTVPSSLPVGVARAVTLRIANPGKRRVACSVHDLHFAECEVRGLPRTFALEPGRGVDMSYSLRALERGDHAFAGTDLVLREAWGLLERRVRVPATGVVHVFPNFAAVARFALHAVDDAVRQLGVRRRRRRGEGMDFDHLREFRIGDTPRQIDWKATSRRRRLIARQFREERDQRIVFLLDCGRRMRTKDGPLSHFDHALDAVLLLSYVALRQGDSVGILATGGLERWVPLVKGRGGLTTILERVYDLQPTLAPFDPTEAATRLLRHLPRRALVIWVTNLRDVDTTETTVALTLLRKKHLVVLASMRETVVDHLARAPVATHADALRATAAEAYRKERVEALEALDLRGLTMLDTTPQDLPARVVNRYLEIKRAGML